MIARPATSLRLAGCLALLVCATVAVFAQSPQERDQIELERQRREQQRYDREFENRVRDLRNLGNSRRVGGDTGSDSPSRTGPKLTEAQKRLLEPSEADRTAFALFLRQPDTGLVRLLPREKYDRTTAMPLRGGGAYYSFYKLSHEAGPWSEIRLQNGELQTGLSDMTLGLMAKLGDVPLEELSASHPAVQFLSNLNVPVKYADVGSQADKNGAGFRAGGLLYKSALAAQPRTTYVLRSTVYGEADTVIALRAIRAEADGSIILLWKSLARLKAKKLKDVRPHYPEPIL